MGEFIELTWLVYYLYLMVVSFLNLMFSCSFCYIMHLI